MKNIEDVKVDLVNSTWLSFNKMDIVNDPMFQLLSEKLKEEETVYSVIPGDILLTDKKMAKKAKRLAKLEMKVAKSKKPVDEKFDREMEELASDLADPKQLGKAIIVMTDERIITVYEDLNKMYKLKTFIRNVDDITEIDAKANDKVEGEYFFEIAFGKKEVSLVTTATADIKHFEFTLDQLIEIEARNEIAKNL